MKMKRSEKLGMFTGLVVGVLLLLISVFMIFQTTCKVWGAEKPANATQQGIDVSSHQGKIEAEMKQWKQQDEDVLTYALFPQVATDFFKYREAQQKKVDATVADTKNGAYPV